MKKILAASGAALALGFAMSLATSTPALAISVSDFCKQNGDLGFPSHGACVGALNKSVTEFCKFERANLDPATYESIYGGTGLGACVSFIRHSIKDI